MPTDVLASLVYKLWDSKTNKTQVANLCIVCCVGTLENKRLKSRTSNVPAAADMMLATHVMWTLTFRNRHRSSHNCI